MNPILRQTRDDVGLINDPNVWLENKCHIMTPAEYAALHNQSNVTNSSYPRVQLENGYKWGALDYI